jgi:hypothetical protein
MAAPQRRQFWRATSHAIAHAHVAANQYTDTNANISAAITIANHTRAFPVSVSVARHTGAFADYAIAWPIAQPTIVP